MPRTPKTPAEPQAPPTFDPAVHTDPKQVVHVQLFCACGGVWRQIDPVEIVEPFVRKWIHRHTGDGHGPATIADCIAERETRKEASLRAAGLGNRYERKQYATLDDRCTKTRPWPVFPDRQEG